MNNFHKVPSSKVLQEEPLHFRLCHGCWHLNESNAEVTQCGKCQRAFPSQYSQELFAAQELAESVFAGTRLMPGNGLEDQDDEEGENAQDDVDFDDDDMLDDSTDFRNSGFGLMGLSVLW